MEILCYEVNDEGYIIEHYFLNEEDIEQKTNQGQRLITTSWEDGMYTPKFEFETGSWVEGNKEKLLENLKVTKIEKFNKMCDEKIEAGFFASNGHHYRTNRDDQINMIGQKDELSQDTSIVTVPWKTEDVGYIVHTREEWLTVYSEAFAHKKTQLFKYDNLKKQILLCQDPKEVEEIEWL